MNRRLTHLLLGLLVAAPLAAQDRPGAVRSEHLPATPGYSLPPSERFLQESTRLRRPSERRFIAADSGNRSATLSRSMPRLLYAAFGMSEVLELKT